MGPVPARRRGLRQRLGHEADRAVTAHGLRPGVKCCGDATLVVSTAAGAWLGSAQNRLSAGSETLADQRRLQTG